MKDRIINILYKISIVVIIVLGIWVMAICVRICCATSFHIPTDSMSPAILPGDNVLAEKLSLGGRIFNIFDAADGKPVKIRRLPALSSLKRNDVVVFNFPYPESWDSIGAPIGRYYVKRCVALPGDTLEIRGGEYSVRGYDGTLGNPEGQAELKCRLNGITTDSVARSIGICLDAWPQKDSLGWTVLEFGPLYVPAFGSVVELDDDNYMLYRNYIEWEQGKKLTRGPDGHFMIGDDPVSQYTFLKDYCFVAGDKSDNSQDSRYWGLLPYEHICAKAWLIWKSVDPNTDQPRRDRRGMKIK